MNSTTKKINAMVIVNQHWTHRLWTSSHIHVHVYIYTSTQNKDPNIMYMDDKNSGLIKTKYSSSMSITIGICINSECLYRNIYMYTVETESDRIQFHVRDSNLLPSLSV